MKIFVGNVYIQFITNYKWKYILNNLRSGVIILMLFTTSLPICLIQFVHCDEP